MSWNSRTNIISIKWINHNGWIDIFVIKENYFLFVCIFDISPGVFTQISSRRARWMRNLISHPTSTHSAYFWWTPLPQKQEIPEKTWWWCRYVENTNKKVVFFMIPIPKFILKKCLITIRYFKFKSISLANTWWHEILIRVKRPFLS